MKYYNEKYICRVSLNQHGVSIKTPKIILYFYLIKELIEVKNTLFNIINLLLFNRKVINNLLERRSKTTYYKNEIYFGHKLSHKKYKYRLNIECTNCWTRCCFTEKQFNKYFMTPKQQRKEKLIKLNGQN